MDYYHLILNLMLDHEAASKSTIVINNGKKISTLIY